MTPEPDRLDQSVPNIEDHDDASGEDRAYQRVLLGVVMLAVMTFGSLMTIVTVSLDLIAEDVGSSRATLTWMITGLMLAMAVGTPIAGKLGDIHGHRRLFLIGLAGGIVTTVLSALAWDAVSLITFRVLFGITGAMIMPSGMALMMHAFSVERRATAMGWHQFATTGAPTIGLVAGGPLIDIIGWRALFYGFAAISVVALVLGWRFVRPTPRQENQPLDYPGAAALGGSVLAGLLALTRLSELLRRGEGLATFADPLTVGLIAICAFGAWAFVQVERRSRAPMLQLDYFRRRNFTLPMLAAAMIQFAYMGGFVVTPALLGTVYGITVGTIAVMLTPRPGVFSLASPVGGYLATRLGERRPIIIGAGFMVTSMAAFVGASLVGSDTGRTVGIVLTLAGLALSGAAAGISQPSVAAMVVGSVDDADMGIANGMNQQITLIGVVSGIQTMNVFLGDSTEPGRFAATFAVGLAIAVLGMLFALGTIDPRRSSPTPG